MLSRLNIGPIEVMSEQDYLISKINKWIKSEFASPWNCSPDVMGMGYQYMVKYKVPHNLPPPYSLGGLRNSTNSLLFGSLLIPSYPTLTTPRISPPTSIRRHPLLIESSLKQNGIYSKSVFHQPFTDILHKGILQTPRDAAWLYSTREFRASKLFSVRSTTLH